VKLRISLLSIALIAGALLAGWLPVRGEASWMSEEAVRAELVGTPLEGYNNNVPVVWRSIFEAGGRYRFSERVQESKKLPLEGRLHFFLEGTELQAEGRWYFRGRALCTLYEGPPFRSLKERCSAVSRISVNCYQWHTVRLIEEGGFRPEPLSFARGWRQGEPSTCEVQPSS
jgi:hypothetical protein